MLNYPENLSDEISAYKINEKGLSGYYPIGVGDFWHSGIHLPISSDTPIKPLVFGQVIAYRIGKKYQTIDLPQKLSKEKLEEYYSKHKTFYDENDEVFYLNGKISFSEAKINFANNFILLEHFIKDKDGEVSLKFYTLYTNIASSSKKEVYQEDFITDGKIHVLKGNEKFYCSLIGPAGYDRDKKYIEISCFIEKSLFDIKFNSKKLIFHSAENYKDFFTREPIKSEKKQFYFTNRSRYIVKEIITSGSRIAKKIQIKAIAAYLPLNANSVSESGKKAKINESNIDYVILNETLVYKNKTSNYNLINTSLDSFFSTCKKDKEYTITNILENGQTQILIDCSNSKPVWILDNDFSSEVEKEESHTKNIYVDYYQECPLFYSLSKKEIDSIDTIKGLTGDTCLDKNRKEYCEIDGLPEIYVEKQAFEKKCYENAFKWEAFFDNQEEFEDDIFCDKLSLLKKLDDSSILKDIFKTNRMISEDDIKMFFGPNEHSLEMKDVVKKLRRVECKHPLEFDKAKFENIADEYKKRKEWTMGTLSESATNALKTQIQIRDIWTDGLSKIFKKNNFFFVHPIYFLNHLDKAGLFEFNPYEGKRYEEIYNYDTKNMKPADEEKEYYIFEKAGEKKPYNSYYVKSNPGIATEWSSWGVKIKGNKVPFYAGITGFFNAQYLSEHPNYKEYWHEGVDFRGSAGTTVYSLIYGKVIRCGSRYSNGQTQGFILLQSLSDENLYYLALHVDKETLLVKNGQDVTPEMPIGHTMLLKSSNGKDISHLHVSVIRLPDGTDPEGAFGAIRKYENTFPVWGDFQSKNQKIWKNMINPFNYEDSNTWQGCYK